MATNQSGIRYYNANRWQRENRWLKEIRWMNVHNFIIHVAITEILVGIIRFLAFC